MNVLVTGGAGFIGSHLVERLIKEGHNVTVVDESNENIRRNLTHLEDKCRIIRGDVNEIQWLAIVNIDCVVHLAALADIVPSIERPIDYHRANVSGTIEVLEFARKLNVKKFIYAASGSCYGDEPPVPTKEDAPINCMYPYALTKHIGEQYALHYQQVYGLNVTSLRFFNVYGPRSRTTGAYGAVFGVFLAQKLAGKPLTIVGDGEQRRDFTYVSDAVDAICLSMDPNKPAAIYNIGSERPTRIKDLAAMISHKVEYIPKRPGEPDVTWASSIVARKWLGYFPKVNIVDGVRTMIENIAYWKDAPVWDKESIAKATEKWHEHLGDKNAH